MGRPYSAISSPSASSTRPSTPTSLAEGKEAKWARGGSESRRQDTELIDYLVKYLPFGTPWPEVSRARVCVLVEVGASRLGKQRGTCRMFSLAARREERHTTSRKRFGKPAFHLFHKPVFGKVWFLQCLSARWLKIVA